MLKKFFKKTYVVIATVLASVAMIVAVSLYFLPYFSADFDEDKFKFLSGMILLITALTVAVILFFGAFFSKRKSNKQKRLWEEHVTTHSRA